MTGLLLYANKKLSAVDFLLLKKIKNSVFLFLLSVCWVFLKVFCVFFGFFCKKLEVAGFVLQIYIY